MGESSRLAISPPEVFMNGVICWAPITLRRVPGMLLCMTLAGVVFRTA
jgi:hypothetical protein